MKQGFGAKFALLLLLLAGLFIFRSLSISQNLCANSISCVNDLSGKFDTTLRKATFHNISLGAPSRETIARAPTPSNVLGEKTANKRIEIDLSSQTLHAFEDGKEMFSFPISSGKWYPTPTGTFHVWVKLRYTKMEGGDRSIGTYYNLPNVPYVMFFYNNQVPKSRGFGMHGTYWHNNFGHPMSHGCVNMRTEDVEKLYYWADPSGDNTKGPIYATSADSGTEVIIYGEAPKQ